MKYFSASSINLYKQCPRRFYYRYIKKLPEPPNIHAVRGNIVHSVLEHFFDIDIRSIEDHEKGIRKHLDRLLDRFWMESKDKLRELDLEIETLNEFYVDSRDMLERWATRFIRQLQQNLDAGDSLLEAFTKLKPKAEEYLKDSELALQGFVDALFILPDGTIKIVDYKTSRKDIITPEYTLQAGIYALLIHKIKGKPPEVVTFDFLKGELQDVTVDDELLKNTEFEVEQIKMSTQTEDVVDYHKKPSGLCKWSNERGSGQCPFYEICRPFDN